ncbi:hypothetical protein DFH07DRAFT_277768 [Mycena maculata]|uniref:Extracellular membrane protein CFEM domain-containing protein n=1 Tax=Mycena maculata TaxID=230809 RepID=A0AAD7HMX9_9AGAR|nr:hypothetical protein DFH07DRAFT_277768 [Mycena maculata]
MRLLAHLFGPVGIHSLAALAPVFLLSSPASALVAPRNINATLVPTACAPVCQPALSAQSTCGSNFTCLCTNANGNNFAACMDCVVGPNPGTLAQSAGQNVLSDFVGKCAQNNDPISSLTLSVATPTASASVEKSNAAMHAPHSFVSVIVTFQFIFLVAWVLL